MKPSKHDLKLFRFGPGHVDGGADLKELLGGKGANLAEMCRIGLPVPPGFTLPTSLCHEVIAAGQLPGAVRGLLAEGIAFVETTMGRKLGDPTRPLLLSVRSGARASMPGMMDTVLNLGLNDDIALAFSRAEEARGEDPRFVWDAYRRLLHMFGDVVLGLAGEDRDPFADALDEAKADAGASSDLDLDARALQGLCRSYRALLDELAPGRFPDEPRLQVERAVEAVFLSWNTPRAETYRAIHRIPSTWGTACNVQAMVFGDRAQRSATGVCFTRDPSTGAPGLIGEALESAQGEDVVAGVRTPLPLAHDEKVSLARLMPEAYAELDAGATRLERHFRDMQDIEFTIEEGKLWFLQTRTGKRTGRAAVRIAVEMVGEHLITREEALARVEPRGLEAFLRKVATEASLEAALDEGRLLATGLPASPGTAVGELVFTSKAALARRAAGVPVVLARPSTSADDIPGLNAAEGVVTARGGMTSHAAVVARGMGKPAVVGCEELHIDVAQKCLRAGVTTIREGEVVSLDGERGQLFAGSLTLADPDPGENLAVLLGWADEVRKLGVRANADTPDAARDAARLGADGIGLCRTEHMFFAKGALIIMRSLILAEDDDARNAACARLLPLQRHDFIELFAAMGGKPVTIRLLDPPLHEFLPNTDEAAAEVARATGHDLAKVKERVAELREENPMLGHRGVRLALSYPAIARMQVRAMVEAALAVTGRGGAVHLEVMVPLVADPRELDAMVAILREEVARTLEEAGPDAAPPFTAETLPIGTMIELPRACLLAGDLAERAAFFSFGTNDLTQTTFGLSRDDAGSFLPAYLTAHILDDDPFLTLDERGVGALVELAVERGRARKPDLELGICGEHGGDPRSIAFCHRLGLDYVSCSPHRVPGARLAAAQATLRGSR